MERSTDTERRRGNGEESDRRSDGHRGPGTPGPAALRRVLARDPVVGERSLLGGIGAVLLAAVLAAALGPAGVLLGPAVVVAWYWLGPPFAAALASVGALWAPALAWEWLAALSAASVPLAAGVAGETAPAGTAARTLVLATGVLGAALAGAWILGPAELAAAVAVGVGVLSYGLYRYGLVALGVVEA